MNSNKEKGRVATYSNGWNMPSPSSLRLKMPICRFLFRVKWLTCLNRAPQLGIKRCHLATLIRRSAEAEKISFPPPPPPPLASFHLPSLLFYPPICLFFFFFHTKVRLEKRRDFSFFISYGRGERRKDTVELQYVVVLVNPVTWFNMLLKWRQKKTHIWLISTIFPI